MRTVGAILIKHRFSVSVLAIATLTATACATSNDSTQPATPTETRAATASPSTTETPATPPPEVSATQPPTTTTKPPIATTTSYSTTGASDTQPPTTTTAPPETTIPPPLLDNIAISTGAILTCSLHSDGTISCWGGYIEDPTEQEIAYLSIPRKIPRITDATAVSVGGSHACALTRGETVYCWGSNYYGELGNGTTEDSKEPVQVSNINKAIAITSASDHSCAVHSDGAVSCWGRNQDGQLGNGTFSDTPIATKVSGITNAIAVSAKYRHTCALHNNGTISCWGRNYYGALGNGAHISSTNPTEENNSSIPVKVMGIENAAAISAGLSYTCALHVDRTISCWGSNMFSGKLGDGTTRDSSTPVKVLDIDDATSIVTGNSFACAFRATNRVTCWGENRILEETNIRSVFFDLANSERIVSLSPGLYWHICALYTDTTVHCWGITNEFQEWEKGRIGNNFVDPARNVAYIIAPEIDN